MNIGDYVRTDTGIIQKIGKIYEQNETNDTHIQLNRMGTGKSVFILDNDKELSYSKGEVIKSSPNIIDLIEEHDILKIEEQKGVYTICEVEEFRDPYVNYKFLGIRLENQSRARKLYELNIKSIVTKEQFESMKYKVGE